MHRQGQELVSLVRARRALVVFNALSIFCCPLCLLDTFLIPARIRPTEFPLSLDVTLRRPALGKRSCVPLR
jgi:hypothetical protein